MLYQVLASLTRRTSHGECLSGVGSPREGDIFGLWAQALARDPSAGTRTVEDAVLPSLSIGDLPHSGRIVMICLSAFQNDSWITNG
jgi:hypothetical protein